MPGAHTLGYHPPRFTPLWQPLPSEEFYYPTPDPTRWKDAKLRRQYRRQRMARHQLYLSALSWRRSLVRADLERRLKAARCGAESAWLLDEELARWFGHQRPRHGPCTCEHEYFGEAAAWWPFPEVEWEEPVILCKIDGRLAGWHG